MDKAKNRMIDVEKLSDLEREALAKTYEEIRIKALERHTRRNATSRETTGAWSRHNNSGQGRCGPSYVV